MFAYCNNNPVGRTDFTGALSQPYTYNEAKPIGSRAYDEHQKVVDSYSAAGVTLYPSEWSALMSWRSTYLPLSEEYEYCSYLYSVGTSLGTYYYFSPTYKGSMGGNIMSPNVLMPVAFLHIRDQVMGGNFVAMVHTHPSPGIGFHNDYPSFSSTIYGGDRLVFNLLDYTEMYVIPFDRCDSTPLVISVTDRTTWCEGYKPQ